MAQTARQKARYDTNEGGCRDRARANALARWKRLGGDHRIKRGQKVLARAALNRAVQTGLITRLPCNSCGSLSSEAHHQDYDKPFDVQWFCREHHAEWHRTHPKETLHAPTVTTIDATGMR